jgi:hypothetical protein
MGDGSRLAVLWRPTVHHSRELAVFDTLQFRDDEFVMDSRLVTWPDVLRIRFE